jgi:3-hydroxymyristoyl/3-hydroxydecanoyl-(acyl carrier protein) dehydratase
MRFLGEFTIGADHPALPGHFPGRPIVPGVVLLDEAFSVMATSRPLQAPFVLIRVKFLSPVLPDQRVTVLANESAAGAMRLSCACGQRPVLQAELSFTASAQRP